ncbi:hypothetical protein O181_025730 [Austropuccinia psidii MF-1]|uniref:Uncharacterized protein n=1 Tax=Austropuccinia psidii MF-1 TaxID=1389203 RepID=A0A9Q3CN69_9BASI|nr:hypothetical protein [Austropuccinia psidii MF-1]
MTAPSQDKTRKKIKTCLWWPIRQSIEKPVRDIKRLMNPLEKDLKISSSSKNPANLWKLSKWIGSGLAYKTSIHTSTNQTPAILEKGWNPELPQDSLRKALAEIHPTAGSFKGMLYKARKHAIWCMEDSFAYAEDKWDKSHATPDFKVGDLVLLSTTNLNNIKGC